MIRWYVETMHSPYRTEWERSPFGYETSDEAIKHAAQFLKNYSLEKVAVRLVRVDS